MAFGQKKPLSEDEKRRRHNRSAQEVALRLAKAVQGTSGAIAKGNVEEAVARAIYSSVKMAAADTDVFYQPHTEPLILVESLRRLFGTACLEWLPETLVTAIDFKSGKIDVDQRQRRLADFHLTGELSTDVPSLIRQKIYAIRVVATSDQAHLIWDVFEKVGAVFNDRLADFGNVQRMSTGECARTIAIMDSIRPDEFGPQVKAYVGAVAHEDGFLTLTPSKWLKTFDADLQRFNIAAKTPSLDDAGQAKLVERLKSAAASDTQDPEDLFDIQARKLLAVDAMADEARSA